MNAGNRENRLIRLALAAALLFPLGYAAQPARAQDSPPQPDASEARKQRPSEQQPRRGPHRGGRVGLRDARGHDRGPGRGKHRPRWSRSIFEPSKEDRGPLREGEEERLRSFVHSELPHFAQLLKRIEQRDPQAFRESFPRLVPRLRQLYRIHQRSPELAQLIAQHATNLYRLRLQRLAWRRAPDGGRQHIERGMRAALADNLRVEADALELWADELAGTREERIAERFAKLIPQGADLSREPPHVRGLVESIIAETDETRRQELESELVRILGRQHDRRLEGLRRRVAELRANAADEVDRRMGRLLKSRRGHRPKP